MEHYKNLSLESIEGENWKGVVGCEGIYHISNYGRLKRVSLGTGRGFRGRIGKILKWHPHTRGYLTTSLCKDGVQENGVLQHRLVAMAFVPNPNNYKSVNHVDGNKKNGCATNLEWCTNKQNTEHAISSGLFLVGERCPTSKLKEGQVLEIRKLYANMRVYEIAKMLNYNRGTISDICLNKTWKHLL